MHEKMSGAQRVLIGERGIRRHVVRERKIERQFGDTQLSSYRRRAAGRRGPLALSLSPFPPKGGAPVCRVSAYNGNADLCVLCLFEPLESLGIV